MKTVWVGGGKQTLEFGGNQCTVDVLIHDDEEGEAKILMIMELAFAYKMKKLLRLLIKISHFNRKASL